MNKGFAGVFLIILLTIVGISSIAYLAFKNNKNNDLPRNFPSPTSTHDKINSDESSLKWKTYSDKENGFSIDYPADWIYATNTVNKELDKFEILQAEDVVVITEGDIDTISTYQLGRVIITKEGNTKETDVEKMFDDNMAKIQSEAVVPGNLPSKDKVILTSGNIKVLKFNPFFVDQDYTFILNNKIYQLRGNFANDDEGSGSPKNKSLAEIYNYMINSLKPY